MASGSNAYSGINVGRQGRAGKGKKSAAKKRKSETLAQIKARIARTGDFF